MTPRAKTVEEIREDFLDRCRGIARYWIREDRCNCAEKVEGAVFSMLTMIDGCQGDWPAMDLVMRPHPEDKAYNIENDECWVEDGMVINADVMLHEFFYEKKS
jgi:hypothetical protein